MFVLKKYINSIKFILGFVGFLGFGFWGFGVLGESLQAPFPRRHAEKFQGHPAAEIGSAGGLEVDMPRFAQRRRQATGVPTTAFWILVGILDLEKAEVET